MASKGAKNLLLDAISLHINLNFYIIQFKIEIRLSVNIHPMIECFRFNIKQDRNNNLNEFLRIMLKIIFLFLNLYLNETK